MIFMKIKYNELSSLSNFADKLVSDQLLTLRFNLFADLVLLVADCVLTISLSLDDPSLIISS